MPFSRIATSAARLTSHEVGDETCVLDLSDGRDFKATDDPRQLIDVACTSKKSGRRRRQSLVRDLS